MKKEIESNKKIGIRKWISIILIGLAGQFAWSIENMYLNKFIFSFGSSNYNIMISITVALSAIVACLTTIFIGALSDKLNKRKIFIVLGYILWGISTALFGLISVNNNASLFPIVLTSQSASILVIILDSVMTFFGSSSNDAAFNSYVTKEIDNKNRGKVEAVLSVLPLVSMLIIFIVLNPLVDASHWDYFFFIIGGIVFLVGILSIFLLPKESKKKDILHNESYLKILLEGFKIKTIKENKNLYLILLAYLIFGISTQIFFPYLIIYFENTLNITGNNFSLALGVILIVGSILSVVSGFISDKVGKNKFLIPSILIGFIGFLLCYFIPKENLILSIIFGIIMMYGYIFIGSVFNSILRELIPSDKTGIFMGVRMIFVVALPMIIGPQIANLIISKYSYETYLNEYNEIQTLPSKEIWLYSSLILLLTLIPIIIYLIKVKLDKKKEESKLDLKNEGILLPLKEEDKIKDNNYIPLNEFPNPSLKRNKELLLNGWWDFKISKSNEIPSSYDFKILVPYSIESSLSHINKLIEVDDYLYYHKKVKLDKDFIKNHLFLYLLGIDQVSEIYVNNMKVGVSKSGYLPIKIDLTPLILKSTSELDIVIKVRDTTDSSIFSRGKQHLKRGGIWYTSSSGIYRPIYLESIESKDYIKDFKITYDIDLKEIYVNVITNVNGLIDISFNDINYKIESNKKVTLSLPNMHLWDINDPYLYDIKIKFNNDIIYSYIGFRKIEIKRINKKNRLLLNHKEILLKGILDQGYYYNGNLTPSCYNDYLNDIKNIKELGFNCIRKHIKYEDDIFYHYCDQNGILVIQDFVNGGESYDFLTISYPSILPYKKNQDKNYKKFKRENKYGRELFIEEIKEEVKALSLHPSVIIYTLFNEGWGEFDVKEIYSLIKNLDSSRLIDSCSGWYDSNYSDFYSKHIYFVPPYNFKNKLRASLLSECGGYSLLIKDHFYGKTPFGYKKFKNKEKISKAYLKLFTRHIIPTLKKNNVGFIYTQLSDIEDEINGLYTFDRKVLKIDKEIIKKVNSKIDNLIK